MTHKFHPSILRTYDIRGIFNETLFEEDAYFVGKSFASALAKQGRSKVAVARDVRTSSPKLLDKLIEGLIASGMEVFDVGIGPTPMLYFSVYHLEADAGIMVTGSHNPKNHNGFKMMLKDHVFYGEDIQNLARIVENHDFIEGKGNLIKKEVKQDYIKRLLEDCVIEQSESHLLDELDNVDVPKRKLKIAWDCGNGATGEITESLTQKINAEHFLLFEEMDGEFPNHHPDPTVKENLQDLIRKVTEKKCDFGIAFDGDGDRIGVVDDEGEVIWGDQLMMLYSKEILKKKNGATFIADVKASQVLFDEITRNGGNAIMWKTGHSLIKAKMKEVNADLAGEMSGHIFFADRYYGFDDALYAAIRLIDIIEKSKQSLSEIRKSLPQTFSTPEIRIICEEERKFQIVENLKENLRNNSVEFNDIDGIRTKTANGWWLIRASNTQPALVARCEADSPESLQEMKNSLIKHLEFCQVGIPNELK